MSLRCGNSGHARARSARKALCRKGSWARRASPGPNRVQFRLPVIEGRGFGTGTNRAVSRRAWVARFLGRTLGVSRCFTWNTIYGGAPTPQHGNRAGGFAARRDCEGRAECPAGIWRSVGVPPPDRSMPRWENPGTNQSRCREGRRDRHLPLSRPSGLPCAGTLQDLGGRAHRLPIRAGWDREVPRAVFHVKHSAGLFHLGDGEAAVLPGGPGSAAVGRGTTVHPVGVTAWRARSARGRPRASRPD